MAAPVFVVWDYVVLVGFLLLSTLIGLYFAWADRNVKSNRTFLTANKQMGWKPVSLSMMASFLSSIAILGLPSETFVHGCILWLGSLSSTFAIIIATVFFLPMYYKMDVTSINEYLERRFHSKTVRTIASITFMAQQLLYMGVVLYGPSLALGSVTGLPVWISILLNGLVCTFYTSVGGIKAVVWTDVMQMILIYVGYILVVIIGLKHLGGFGNMWRIAGEGGRLVFTNFSFNMYETYTTWNILLSWTIGWLGAYCCSQTQVQRYVSMGSLNDARKACLVNIPGVGLTLLLASLCGLILYAIYGNCDPRLYGEIEKADQLMPYIVQDLLRDYPGFSGLLVACVFSGSLSTLSSGYNALAAVTWDDFIARRVNWSHTTEIVVTKLIAATFGVLSIAVAFVAGSMNSIVEASGTLISATTGPQMAVFMVGFFLPFVKEKGAITGMIGGIAVGWWLAFGSLTHKRPGDPLPTSTANCSNPLINSTLTAGSLEPIKTPEGMLQFYHISFIWITFVGFAAAFVFTILGCLVFDLRDEREVDPKCVAPSLRRFVKSSKGSANRATYKAVPHADYIAETKNVEFAPNGNT